jgi:protein-L-isoaspartate(D-aspartate) O-methyltransferase
MGCNGSKSASPPSSKGQPPATSTEENREDGAAQLSEKTLLADLCTTRAPATKDSTLDVPAEALEPCVDVANSAVGKTTRDAKQTETFEPKLKVTSAANIELVRSLQRNGALKSPTVEKAMLCTDRGDYAPQEIGDAAYADSPHPIGHAATISAPHMHAHALELLADFLVPGARALDIGCGSGYVAVCMARMVGSDGLVIGVDHVKPLVDLAVANIKKNDSDLLETSNVVVLRGDGWKGCPQDGPFDCIHVGAAAETVPQPLLEQLKPGGRMVIPVGKQMQQFCQIDRKLDGEYVKTQLMSVRYVPLVRATIGPACCPMSLKKQPEKQTSAQIEEPSISKHPQPVEEALPAPGKQDTLMASPEANVPPAAGAAPAQAEKDLSMAKPVDVPALPTLSVTGAPSVQPSDAKCCWCKDVC